MNYKRKLQIIGSRNGKFEYFKGENFPRTQPSIRFSFSSDYGSSYTEDIRVVLIFPPFSDLKFYQKEKYISISSEKSPFYAYIQYYTGEYRGRPTYTGNMEFGKKIEIYSLECVIGDTNSRNLRVSYYSP